MGLSTALEGRRLSSRPASRASHRPQFEKLEDRVVPSIADGTILVTTGPSSFASVDQSAFPTGIIGVDPHTGTQFPISTGGVFSLPTYVCEAPNQQLYVSDLTAFGTGAIFRVDPNTGQQFLLTKGGYLDGPNGLAYVNGYLYVANTGDGSGKVHSIVQVDPNTSQQRLITSDGGFVVPTGLAAGPGNSLYVADEPGGWSGSDPGGVWQVNLSTGAQTQVTHGGYIVHCSDVKVDPNGNLLTMGSTSETDPIGSIVRTNPVTGVQTQVSHDGILYYLDGMTVDLGTGIIYTGAISTGAIPAALYAVDPVTGAQSTIATGGLMSLVEGINVFHTTVNTNAKATTSTVVTATANGTVLGQGTTFTATVSVAPPAAGTPTGTVQFQIDGANFGNPVTLASSGNVATASLSTTSLTVGTHTVNAIYSGDSGFTASSGSLTNSVIVNKDGTTLALVSSANPSTAGQTITLSATVTAVGPGGTALANPSGVVTFLDGGQSLGLGTLSSSGGKLVASFTTSGLTVGSHNLSASYGGDGNFTGSSASLAQQVLKISTNLSVAASANPATVGQAVTFTATVSGTGSGKPSGVVVFSEGATSLGQGTLTTTGGVSTASFTTSSLPVGSHTLNASYAGDSTFQGSAGTLTERIQAVVQPTQQNNMNTTTILVTTGPMVAFGQPVTLSATVLENMPAPLYETGSVVFLDGDVPLATVPVNQEIARFTTSTLSIGSHALVAVYSGDSMAQSSRSGTVTVTVGTSDERFVAQLYLNLLKRQPEPAGLASWVGDLTQGMSRSTVSMAIEQSPEGRTTQAKGLYQKLLHRTADPDGLNTLVSFLGSGGTLEQAETAITSSSEYLQVRGGGSTSGFITALYQDALGRAPDAAGVAQYTQALNQGASRFQVAGAIFGSTEHLRKMVANSYEQFLKRAADPTGLQASVTALQAGESSADLMAKMLASDEFVAHV